MEVKEIASFPALQERTKLGAEEFLRFIGEKLGFAGEPPVLNLEGIDLDGVDGLVFARIDFDLQLQFRGGIGFRSELEE